MASVRESPIPDPPSGRPAIDAPERLKPRVDITDPAGTETAAHYCLTTSTVNPCCTTSAADPPNWEVLITMLPDKVSPGELTLALVRMLFPSVMVQVRPFYLHLGICAENKFVCTLYAFESWLA
jgi:hypothetical protein